MTWGLVLLLLISTLGEGGAADRSLLLWHGLLAVLLCLRLLRGSGPDRRPSHTVSAALVAFVACAVVGGILASYKYAAWLTLLEIGAFVGVFWMAAESGRGLLCRLRWPLMAGGALLGLHALIQVLQSGSARPAATFLNPNHLGAWLAAVLVFAWSDSPDAGPFRRLLPQIGLSLPMIAGLAATTSRGAFLGLAAGAAVAAALSWRRWTPPVRRIALAGGAVLLVLGALLAVQRVRQPDPFLYQRARIWKASLVAAAERPWSGTGPRQFAVAAARLQFPDGDGPLRYDRVFRSPHSDWVRAPAEFGLPASLAVLAVAGALLLLVRRRSRLGELTATDVAALSAVVVLATHATVSNLTHRPALYLLGAVLIGGLASVRRTTAPGPPNRRSIVAALLLSLVFVIGDVGPFLAFRSIRGLPPGRLDDPQRSRLEQSLKRNRIHPLAWLRRAEDIAGDGSDWNLEGYAVAREAAERAARLDAADARFRRGVARVEALACQTLFGDEGTRGRAREQYLQAEALAPHDPFIPVELSTFLLRTGDAAGARRAAERALWIEPQAALPRLLLAEAILMAGSDASVDEAVRLLAEAKEIGERWTGSPLEPYARKLLSPERRLVERVEIGVRRPREVPR